MKQIEIPEPILVMIPGSKPPTPVMRGGDDDDPRREEPDDPWAMCRWFESGIENTRPFNETHKGRKASRRILGLFTECEEVRVAGESENPQIHIIDGRVFLGLDNDDHALCKTAVEGMIPGIVYGVLKQLMAFEDSIISPLDKLPRATKPKPKKKSSRNGVKRKQRKPKPEAEAEA